MAYKDHTPKPNSQTRTTTTARRDKETVHPHQMATERWTTSRNRRQYWEVTSGQVRTVNRSNSPMGVEIRSVSEVTSTVRWARHSTDQSTLEGKCWRKAAERTTTSRTVAISSPSSSRASRYRSNNLLLMLVATHSQLTRSLTKLFLDFHSSKTSCRFSHRYQDLEIKKQQGSKRRIQLEDQPRTPSTNLPNKKAVATSIIKRFRRSCQSTSVSTEVVLPTR